MIPPTNWSTLDYIRKKKSFDLPNLNGFFKSLTNSIFRHPSYFGFYWFVVFSQLMLFNPISAMGTAYFLSQHFFKERIEYEEETLIEKFGDKYKAFRTKTIIGIPGCT